MKIRYIALSLFIFSGVAFGQATNPKDILLGFKLGYLGSGTVKVEGVAFGTDSSHSFGGFLDYKVAEKLYVGFHLFMHNMSAFGISKNLMDIGGSFKAIIPTRNEQITIRPALNLGYGALPEITLGKFVVDSSSYFLIGPSVELHYDTNNNYDLIGEVGFLSAPSGGNSDFSVSLSPTLFLRAGIAF